MKLLAILAWLSLSLAQNCCPINPAMCEDSRMADLSLPPGFCISRFAQINQPRSLDVHDDPILGTVVFTGTRPGSNMNVVIDSDQDGRADRTVQFATGQNRAHIASMRNNKLYIGQGTRLTRYDNIMNYLYNGTTPPLPTVMYSRWGTANSGNHGDRVMTWRNNNTDLYVSIGTPCNTCIPEDQNCAAGECHFGEIIRIQDIHNKNTITLADQDTWVSGVRNSVGITTSPDDMVWFTDNGRDNWGDNRPADELNRAPIQGQTFGYPYCYGYNDADTQFNPSGSCAPYVPATVELGPHVAALGLTFYTGDHFPPPWDRGIYIAEHGSWNRRPFIGFRITHVDIAEGGKDAKDFRYANLVEGWLLNPTFGTRWGRPSDIAQLPDGSLIVSDDTANVIWRISYGGTQKGKRWSQPE